MKKIIIIVLAITLGYKGYTQTNLLNSFYVEEIGQYTLQQIDGGIHLNLPLEFAYVDDRDILWGRIIWEYIDLSEKFNYHLYYPTDTTNVDSGRRSLFQSILTGISTGEIMQVFDDSFFNYGLTLEELRQRIYRVDTTEAGLELLNAGITEIDEYVDVNVVSSQDIVGYSIRGIWYFDRKYGELKYRVLAIAPMAYDIQLSGLDEIEKLPIPLFWVFYPNVRRILTEQKIFNPQNPSERISFDHILNSRRFSSVITREENIYGNRDISDYTKLSAWQQVLESERIKEEIRQKESEMWSMDY